MNREIEGLSSENNPNAQVLSVYESRTGRLEITTPAYVLTPQFWEVTEEFSQKFKTDLNKDVSAGKYYSVRVQSAHSKDFSKWSTFLFSAEKDSRQPIVVTHNHLGIQDFENLRRVVLCGLIEQGIRGPRYYSMREYQEYLELDANTKAQIEAARYKPMRAAKTVDLDSIGAPTLSGVFFPIRGKIATINFNKGGQRVEFIEEAYFAALAQAKKELSHIPSLILIRTKELLDSSILTPVDKLNLAAFHIFSAPHEQAEFFLAVRYLSTDVPSAQLNDSERERLAAALKTKGLTLEALAKILN